jgi:hypothetical protein
LPASGKHSCSGYDKRNASDRRHDHQHPRQALRKMPGRRAKPEAGNTKGFTRRALRSLLETSPKRQSAPEGADWTTKASIKRGCRRRSSDQEF